MRAYENLLFSKENGIGYVTINRPKALNALNAATVEELDALLDEIAADTEIQVVIVTGGGEKSFVAGADITEMRPLGAIAGRAWGQKGQAVFTKLENLPQPVIAAVNGFALGGGCELAMACDIRIASEKAKFGQPETGLGITPGFGGTQRLARLVLQLPLVGFRPALPEIALAVVEVEAGDHPVAVEGDIIAKPRGELRIGLDAVEGPVEFARDFASVDKIGNIRLNPRRRVETGKTGGIREMGHCILSFVGIVCNANE